MSLRKDIDLTIRKIVKENMDFYLRKIHNKIKNDSEDVDDYLEEDWDEDETDKYEDEDETKLEKEKLEKDTIIESLNNVLYGYEFNDMVINLINSITLLDIKDKDIVVTLQKTLTKYLKEEENV